MSEVRTRTCMPHTLKLIIHQEQIAGALPGTRVENAQSAQQNSCWSYLLNAWYLCLYQGTDGTPSCLATWPANVFYIPPPFRGIHMFDLSNLFLIVVVFCCFYCTLNFVSPMTIGTRVLSVSRKCRLAFTNPHFDLTSYPRAVSRVFLWDLLREENTNGAIKLWHEQLELLLTRRGIENWGPVLLSYPSSESTPRTISHITHNRFLCCVGSDRSWYWFS